MAEALEWFQCASCGRRQRWAAELAGKTVRCRCGAEVLCPKGVGLNEPHAGRTGSEQFEETIVEDAESASAAGMYQTYVDTCPEITEEVQLPRTLEEIRATKRFFIWAIGFLIGLAMLIHAVITRWPVYITAAAILVPITFWKFHTARRRWQKGRPFFKVLARSLGAE